MPASVEIGSAARARVRFQDVSDSDSVNSNKSESSSVGSEGFEIKEDPSFWKDHNVQVVIRVRPLNSHELNHQGHHKCIRQESCQTITWTGHPESRFTFDIVADEHVTQIVRCCVENTASIAKTFLTSNVVVVDANENLPRPYWTPMPTSNFMPSLGSNFKPRLVIPF